MKIVIAASKDWFLVSNKSKEFDDLDIVTITNKDDLTFEKLKKIDPSYIFFPHWNWKVSSRIYETFNCIVIHTAPLPFGRGGSPIQNLIIRGFKSTKVSAIKMNEILDGGPIYKQMDISLDGTIDEILCRLAKTTEKIILDIINNSPKPFEQNGKVISFKRLSIKDNELKGNLSKNDIYDRIRMVDGKDYPKAFINFGEYRIEFSNAFFDGDLLNASVTFKINKN